MKTKRDAGDRSLTVDPVGFHIDVYRGFLGVSPDGIISPGDGTRGILEIKCPVKWSSSTPSQAVEDRAYPLTAISEFDHQGKLRIKFTLKPNHKWFHQIQLQLYCCRDFATFLDFGMYHCDSKYIHIERIVLQDSWVQRNILKMDNFFQRYMVPKLLS